MDKGKCKYEIKKEFTDDWYCTLNDQVLTGNLGNSWDTCNDCPDYEEDEVEE